MDNDNDTPIPSITDTSTDDIMADTVTDRPVSTDKPRHNVTPINTGSWLQVNNTVIPLLQRITPSGDHVSYVPLSVLRHGAGVLLDAHPYVVEGTTVECELMSKLCTDAGFAFDFPAGTELIELGEIDNHHKGNVHTKKLPDTDPFSHAVPWRDISQPVDHQCDAAAEDKMESTDGEDSELSRPVSPEATVKQTEAENKIVEEYHPLNKPCSDTVNKSIWRPVSFSPSTESSCSDDQVATESPQYPDLPLDLSTGAPQDRSNTSVSTIKKQVDDKSFKDEHKQTVTVSIARRFLFGKELTVLVKDKEEYLPVDVLRLLFFPHIPTRTILDIIVVIEIPLLDISTQDNSIDQEIVRQYFITTSKMLKFKKAGETVLRIGAVLDPMASYQMGHMFSMQYYMQNMQYFNGLSNIELQMNPMVTHEAGASLNKCDVSEKYCTQLSPVCKKGAHATEETRKCSKSRLPLRSSDSQQRKKQRLLDAVDKIHKNK